MWFSMQPISQTERNIVAGIDHQRMLDRTQEWAAINSGTGNLNGLARMAEVLSATFASLPG